MPGETLLISGAIAAAHGTLDITILLLLAWAGAVVGQTIGWAIGYYGGHRLVDEARQPGRRRRSAASAGSSGCSTAMAIFVFMLGARFMVLLRQLSNGMAAGTLAMR